MTALTEDRLRVRTRLGVNMVVEAGAGTGKTTLLIERLCFALLAQGVSAPRLVALTFTEKAAAEIKTRLIFKLQSVLRAAREGAQEPVLSVLRGHFAVPDEQIIMRAETALDQLDRSQIGTIHGFCADILRAYPLEAGLTPNAEIDKGPRAERIFDAQWNRFLDLELGENAPRAERWKEALSRVSLADLRACAREMCSGKMERYDYFARKDLLAQVCAERARQAAALSGAFLEGKKEPRVIEKALKQAAERFQNAAHWLQTGQLPDKPEETVQIKSVPKDWDGQRAEEAKALCRFAEAADPFVQTWVLKAYGLIEGLAQTVRARYTQEGILSFDDLIVKTRDLLKTNAAVRARLKEAYDVLYIDEFQDTDPVQGELLLFLAEQKGDCAPDWREVRLAPGKLFVVGDPKQSVYRFRGADITAYQLFTDLILKQGGDMAYLKQNFRSEREIIGAANDVCSAVMTERPAFQPAYVPIFTDKQELCGAAELALVCGAERKISADDYRHNQAQFIARWIEENVGKMTLRSGRKLEYKDIAVLSRSATTLGPYTDALRRAGIAFSVEEDRDFYRRQEISDFLNFLRAIDDPLDRISLVGVMRGPLGALSDEEVYQASRRGELDWRRESRDPKLERLFNLLRSFARRAGRQPLRALLRGLISETFLAEACACAYDGERSIANLERLVQLAEGYSLQTPATLGQFLGRVQEMMEQELGRLTALPEGEALNAVSVMTVHKSKGLEFPVVILADASKKESAAAAKRPAHLYSWRHNLHGLRAGKYADINLAWLEEEQKLHAQCEEVRVLYVALTRAREKLLVLGNEESDARTIAAHFMQAGRFPQPGERPEKLGAEDGLRVRYIEYRDPEEFIYKHRPCGAAGAQERDLAAWRRAYDARMDEYARLRAFRAALAPSSQGAGEDVADVEAAALGKLAHEALLRCWRRPQDGLDACLDAAARDGGAPSLKEKAREMLAAFFASPLFRRLRGLKTLGAEMPFSFSTPQGVVSGAADLILQEEDGGVLVVDYKTDKVPPGAEQEAARKYRPQLLAYMRAARALYPNAQIRGAVVFLRARRMVEVGAADEQIGKI